MCGLAGCASDYLGENHNNVFRQLLLLASFRGPHSTGVAIVGRDDAKNPLTVSIEKAVGDPWLFFRESKFEEMLKATKTTRVLMGHARWATKGAITQENAHPFQVGSITLTHNGTIHHDFDGRKDFETDSEAVAALIADRGAKDAFQHIEDKGGGAWACVWYDDEDKTLNMYRNKERPLYILENKPGVIYWSSEDEMLTCVKERNNIDEFRRFELKTNTLLSYDMTKVYPNKHTEVINDFIKERPVVSYTSHYSSAYSDTSWYGNTWNETYKEYGKWQKIDGKDIWIPEKKTGGNQETTGKNGKDTKGNDNNKSKILALVDGSNGYVYKGYNGVPLTSHELSVLLGKGCAWCTNPQSTGKDIRWVNHTSFVCGDCKDDDYVKEFLNADLLMN